MCPVTGALVALVRLEAVNGTVQHGTPGDNRWRWALCDAIPSVHGTCHHEGALALLSPSLLLSPGLLLLSPGLMLSLGLLSSLAMLLFFGLLLFFSGVLCPGCSHAGLFLYCMRALVQLHGHKLQLMLQQCSSAYLPLTPCVGHVAVGLQCHHFLLAKRSAP